MLWRAPPGTLALTFDDGPDVRTTPLITASLEEYGAKATFFVLTGRTVGVGSLIRDMRDAGHDIQLHGDVHVRLDRMSPSAVKERLAAGKAALEQLAGAAVTFLRPPYGRVSVTLLVAARAVGLDVVHWSHDPRDWEPKSPQELAPLLTRCLESEAVILLHDSSDEFELQGAATAAALQIALPQLAERGLRTVTISEGAAGSSRAEV